MAAFDNLPWLTSSEDFLKAMIAGGNRGNEIAQLRSRASASEPGRPQMKSGGGGGQSSPIPYKGPSLEQQAQEQAAWSLYSDLLRRGASDEEARGQSGIERFGAKPASPDRMPSVFGGQDSGYWSLNGGKAVNVVPPVAKKDSGVTYHVQPNPITGEQMTTMSGPQSAFEKSGIALPGAATTRVRMISPDGQTGGMAPNQVDAAKAEGWKVVGEESPITAPNPFIISGNTIGN
jgi:hypothetical protein